MPHLAARDYLQRNSFCAFFGWIIILSWSKQEYEDTQSSAFGTMTGLRQTTLFWTTFLQKKFEMKPRVWDKYMRYLPFLSSFFVNVQDFTKNKPCILIKLHPFSCDCTNKKSPYTIANQTIDKLITREPFYFPSYLYSN